MAGRIPDSFLDELVARSDIVEVISARVPLKKAGREYKACCPFHNEKSPSFWVSPDKQFYHCFGCGAHGTVIGFLMQYEKMEFLDAVADLAQRAGLEMPRSAREARDPRRRRPARPHGARLEILRAESRRQPAGAGLRRNPRRRGEDRDRSSRWGTRPIRGMRSSSASGPTRRSGGGSFRWGSWWSARRGRASARPGTTTGSGTGSCSPSAIRAGASSDSADGSSIKGSPST